MTLKKREKILVGATVALLVILAGRFLFIGGGGVGSLDQLRSKCKDLDDEVQGKRKRAERGRKAAARLAQWQKQSLPWDHEVARSLYQTRLRELVDQVKLRGAKVESTEGEMRGGVYYKQRFTIRARGTLDQLTELLHGFYSADYLHKIGRLTIKPIEDSQDLDLTVNIEALALPGADAKNKLPEGKAKRLKLAQLADYRKTVVRRKMESAKDGEEQPFAESGGLFAAYEPKRAPPPEPIVEPRQPEPEPPSFDLTKHTYVTATLEVDGRPQVWMDVRTKGDKLRLFEGDPFTIGEVDGKIVQIMPRQRYVVIEIDGQQREIRLGNNLHQMAQAANVDRVPQRQRKPALREEPPAEEKPAAEEKPGAEEKPLSRDQPVNGEKAMPADDDGSNVVDETKVEKDLDGQPTPEPVDEPEEESLVEEPSVFAE
ncbi:MAG: hypothetical protein A2V70_01755 [Planctomycetes bacterium RBG_13_63_9]|nr:MAG: hypothetical protein A2V70_01755 [Planctomycetes bacterium RBG_13_63_9]